MSSTIILVSWWPLTPEVAVIIGIIKDTLLRGRGEHVIYKASFLLLLLNRGQLLFGFGFFGDNLWCRSTEEIIVIGSFKNTSRLLYSLNDRSGYLSWRFLGFF